MKYETRSHAGVDTLRLQGIGIVVGEPAVNIKKGDVLMWNYGEIETVTGVYQELKHFIKIKCETKTGYSGIRKIKKNKLVCILR